MLVVTFTALCLVSEAGAVFTAFATDLVLPGHAITLRVGTNTPGAVDTVNFGTIAGDKVGDGATQPTAAAVRLDLRARSTIATYRTVTLTADSSAGMACISGTCLGPGTVIPFSQVSWTSNATAPFLGNFDVQNSSFNGSSAQTLASFTSGSRIQHDLIFKYNNTTVYPAGSYSGKVRFTASMP